MTGKGPVWVAILDLDGAAAITPVHGRLHSGQEHARLLTRMHGAPLGYVSVPLQPLDSLAVRARPLAEQTLASMLSHHVRLDGSATGPGDSLDWAIHTACPRRFPDLDGTGITVAVCTRDRADSLRECLRSLLSTLYRPIEILVVDNAPTCGATRELVAETARRDPRVRYTCEPAPGLSRARNRALAEASHDIVAFTDDDTLADPGWPTALAAGFAADPAAVCVTGLVMPSALDTASERYFDARYGSRTVFEPRRFDLSGHGRATGLYPFTAGVFGTGANFAVRRRALTGIGGFDPLLGAGGPGRGGEDLDMFLRVILAGGRICYVPTAFVWHRHRTDTRALGEQVHSYGHGLGAYLAKHAANRELQSALLRHGIRQAGLMAGSMRHASRASRLGAVGTRLAVREATGIVTGALRYWRAKREPLGEPDAHVTNLGSPNAELHRS